MSMSPFVAQVVLRELGLSVDKGVQHLLDYEASNIKAFPEAMLCASDALRIAKKFNAADRHGPKSVISEEVLMHWVNQFPTNEYGKQQAERELSKTRDQSIADMWTWFNELGGYVKAGA